MRLNNFPYRAFVIEESNGTFSRSIKELNTESLPEADLLIRVHYAGLNYKDGLSASGHKGVTKNYPHTPGVDAAGVVVESDHPMFVEGDEIIVTSYDLGMNTAGGFGEYISVPAGWGVHLPKQMTTREAMILGTAGFTAGLAIHKMMVAGQRPEMGPILVTGATGGVGSMAVALLHKAGFEVIASTGKQDANSKHYLRQLGADTVVDRAFANDESGRPLLKAMWAGAIDTVGGNTLATCLKACDRNGNVATTGLVSSAQLNTTVYPFILNGVNLLGVDSAECPMDVRMSIWKKLNAEWKPDMLEEIGLVIGLEDLDAQIDLILKGKVRGRVVVRHND